MFKRYLLIALGWLFVGFATIGAVLPLLPTTPFLILALACFAKSSPHFHSMLLNNKWFGPPLTQWEQNHTIRRKIKFKAIAVIVTTFGISIFILMGRMQLQLMLALLCLFVLGFVWRLKETEE